MAHVDGLERMKRLLEELGDPEKDFKVFHVAGTNGKGSTVSMIALMLEQKGYNVGVYTSPHLESYCERFQIWNGEHRLITEKRYEELGRCVDEAASRLPEALRYGSKTGITVFERLTAIAYMWFAEERPDYVVLECGLGGRLDSTNTIERPLVSVITQVGMDHTAILGRTILKIAAEKAGIIKPGVPVVSQTEDLLVRNVFTRIARERGCDFYDASLLFDQLKGTKLPLQGKHQLKNYATACAAMQAAGLEPETFNEDTAVPSTCYGRFEIIGKDPYWILDGGHNPDAIDALADTYTSWSRKNKIRRTLVIFGCMKDKNYGRMVQSITAKLKGCTYATVTIHDERAADSETLGEAIAGYGRNVICYDDAEEAFASAKDQNYEAVLVTGSIYLVGEMRRLLLEQAG
ncbi:MAG: bifunctional folylpolyglutamate synthase/dihydrofolate synthase [Mogibacterium sp.]|nr:bifunctional folylpolyglutamate synthase/dihydrofolate synthase [Mogibacterium sp.]